jgi:hypothetical protein
MRNITILAFATAGLAIVTVVTDLIRADAGSNSKVPASPVVQQVQTEVGVNVKI